MERDSFETLGDMEVTGGRIGWLAAGPVEALVRTGGAQGVQSRMRQMFLSFCGTRPERPHRTAWCAAIPEGISIPESGSRG